MPNHHLLPALCILLLTACSSPTPETAVPSESAAISAGQEPSFTALLADSLEGWALQNAEQSSFSLSEGILQVSGDRGWLQSPRQYGDFVLRTDFRFLEPSSDSGIFLRVEPGTDFILGWPGDAYQVQVRDISENPGNNPLPLAQVYRHVVPDGNTIYNRDMVDDSYSGVGEWQHYEIRVLGRQLTVSLNGTVVTTARDLDNLAGHIGFQSERGSVEYRNIQIYQF